MARLWAKTVTFDSVRVGDRLPILVKWETAETMKRLNAQVSPASGSQEVDEQELSLHSAVLVSYVNELLEKAFPVSSITAPGSSIQVEPLASIRPDDTISLSGKVVAKCEEEDSRLVECEIIVEGEDGKTMARGVAVVSL
jgi:hypothetical protein